MRDVEDMGPYLSYKLTAFGRPLTRVEEPLRPPEGTEVVLRVGACGVCHSDLHVADGYFDLGGGKRMDLSRGIALPRTLGHEIAGTVVAVGPQAGGVAIGDRRIVFPWIGCGTCGLCQSGSEQLCARPASHGTTADGGFSTHTRVPHPRYLIDPGSLPDSYAATLACSGLTAYAALRKAGPVSADNPLLVIGAGGVGLAAVSIARALYGSGPLVADIDPAKRQAALDGGAIEAVDPADPELKRRLLKATHGGFASVVDFVGASATAELGLSLLRKGGTLVSVGLFGGSLELSLPLLPLRAIRIVGSYVGSLEEMNDLVTLARTGALQPVPTHTYPLSEAQAMLEALRQGRIAGRAVLVPEVDTER